MENMWFLLAPILSSNLTKEQPKYIFHIQVPLQTSAWFIGLLLSFIPLSPFESFTIHRISDLKNLIIFAQIINVSDE